MRRFPLLLSLVLLLVGLFTLSCYTAQPGPAASVPGKAGFTELGNPCASNGHDPNPMAPIVCVDDSAFPTIKLVPDPATATHVYTSKTVQWFTSSASGTIAILYDSNLLDAPDTRPGRGHTMAKAGNQAGSVKYSVVVQRGSQVSNVIDPTIIIDTCCG